MKSGWKTTEFWIVLLANVGALITMVAGLLPEQYGVIGVAIADAAYALSRGLAKGGASNAQLQTELLDALRNRPRDPGAGG